VKVPSFAEIPLFLPHFRRISFKMSNDSELISHHSDIKPAYTELTVKTRELTSNDLELTLKNVELTLNKKELMSSHFHFYNRFIKDTLNKKYKIYSKNIL
jgi:hypothetical protein